MKIVINGKEVVIPSGGSPAGDGTPIGTIISFLGTAAPKGYLVCDGAEYLIADHPALADFFRQQFGASSYFGGDGETTFALPDMRNLFLRGYHGGAEEQLSSDVGQKQEATKHKNIVTVVADDDNSFFVSAHPSYSGVDAVHDTDSYIGNSARTVASMRIAEPAYDWIPNPWYTSRPVNMAVLYCIKAEEYVPNE